MQQRIELKLVKSLTGPARVRFQIYQDKGANHHEVAASESALNVVVLETALSVVVLESAVATSPLEAQTWSVVVVAEALHLKAMESPGTLATGNARVHYLLHHRQLFSVRAAEALAATVLMSVEVHPLGAKVRIDKTHRRVPDHLDENFKSVLRSKERPPRPSLIISGVHE